MCCMRTHKNRLEVCVVKMCYTESQSTKPVVYEKAYAVNGKDCVFCDGLDLARSL